MEISKVFSDINYRGFTINRELAFSLMREFKNRALKASYTLMDWGYVSELNFTDPTELIKALSEEFGADIEALFSQVDGTIYISVESVEVARKITKNEEFKKVLGVLYEYCYTVELLGELTELMGLLTKNKFFNPKVSITTRDISVNSSNFINRREFLSIIEEVKSLRLLNVKSLLYFEFLESIGIPEESVVQYKQTNRGILINEFTFLEEIDICNYIMEFHIKPNSPFKGQYMKGLRKFYDTKTKKVDKAEYFREYVEDIKTILDSIVDEEIEPRLITKNVFIFEQKKPRLSEELRSIIGQPIIANTAKKRIWENSGLYVLDWSTGAELDKCNALFGNTGEFVTKESIRQSKEITQEHKNTLLANIRTLEPTKIVRLSRLNDSGLAKEITNMYRVEDLGLDFRVGKDIIFTYTDINSIFNRYKVTTIQGLFSVIYNEIKARDTMFTLTSNLDYYKLVIADIIMVLITTDCGIEYTSNVPLDNRIELLYENSFNSFYKASFEAEGYIEEKGLWK